MKSCTFFVSSVAVGNSRACCGAERAQSCCAQDRARERRLRSQTFAEDWLVWGGKNRDFRANASGLADSWPTAGPKKLWSRALGDGYSAIAEDEVLQHCLSPRVQRCGHRSRGRHP